MDFLYSFEWSFYPFPLPSHTFFFIVLKPDTYFSMVFREVGTHISNNIFLKLSIYLDFFFPKLITIEWFCFSQTLLFLNKTSVDEEAIFLLNSFIVYPREFFQLSKLPGII